MGEEKKQRWGWSWRSERIWEDPKARGTLGCSVGVTGKLGLGQASGRSLCGSWLGCQRRIPQSRQSLAISFFQAEACNLPTKAVSERFVGPLTGAGVCCFVVVFLPWPWGRERVPPLLTGFPLSLQGTQLTRQGETSVYTGFYQVPV